MPDWPRVLRPWKPPWKVRGFPSSGPFGFTVHRSDGEGVWMQIDDQPPFFVPQCETSQKEVL